MDNLIELNFFYQTFAVNISETLHKAAEILKQNDIAEPRREANSLLAFALGKDNTFLIAHSEYELSEIEKAAFSKFLMRRAAHEPLQYIRGQQEFFGLDFIVTSNVLIPRPETELIVEAAIEILKNKRKSAFLRDRNGFGLYFDFDSARRVKNATAMGADISENALKITKINAEKNAVVGQIATNKIRRF